MDHLIAIFAVYWTCALLQEFIQAPERLWYLTFTVLGMAAQLLVDYHDWWWGVGIAGAAYLVKQVSDLLLVSADSGRLNVLRNTRR